MKGKYKDVDNGKYEDTWCQEIWKRMVIRRKIEMILIKLSWDYNEDENYERTPNVFTNVMEEV